MQVNIKGSKVHVIREVGDERIRDESDLFHKVKKVLNSHGDDLIKKRPDSDGHMFGAPYYLRDREWKFCIIDPHYAIRDAAKHYRENEEIYLELVVWDRPRLQEDMFKEQ